MNILKFLRSNIGTIIIVAIFLLIALSPRIKGLIMTGVIRTGLFDPDVSNIHPQPVEAVSLPEGKVYPQVPSVQFTSSDGSISDLADLDGKVVFLNFWATWCPPCIAEMPAMNSLYNKLKSNPNVVFVLADAEGNLDKSVSFMKRKHFDLPVYILTGSVPKEIFRGNLPTTIIINKKGQIIFSKEGMANYDTPEMVKLLNDLSTERH